MKVSNKPHSATPMHNTCEEAWWYENKGSIQVYVHRGNKTFACRINRRVLKDWLERTEQPPVNE